MKDHKKAQKHVKHSEAVGKEQVVNALKRALALVNAEKGQSFALPELQRCLHWH